MRRASNASGFDSWSFIWEPGEIVLGEDKQRGCTLARNERHTGGRTFQSAYRGWSVSTKKCGYFELSLSLT